MSKYTIVVRKHSNQDWEAWCNTDKRDVADYNIKVIKSYGLQYTLETPFSKTTFLTQCYALGLPIAKVKKFAEGRYKFTSDDVKTLQRKIGGKKDDCPV